MTLKNPTEAVILCENLFGCLATGVDDASLTPTTVKVPLYKARAIEASKIKKAMLRDPRVVTLDNLELAAQYCFEKRIDIKTPYGLVFKIEEALKHVAEPEVTSSLDDLVQRALAWEADQPASSSRDQWITSLTRAHGEARKLVLTDWKQDGRGA